MNRRGFLLALGLTGTVLATTVTPADAKTELRPRPSVRMNAKRRRARPGFGPLPLVGSGMTAPY